MQRLRDARRQGDRAHARALALGTQSKLVLHSQKVQNQVLRTLGYTGAPNVVYHFTDKSVNDHRTYSGITVNGSANFGDTGGGAVTLSGAETNTTGGSGTGAGGASSRRQSADELRTAGLSALAARDKKLREDEKQEALKTFRRLMAQGISKGAAALQTQAIVNDGNEKGKSMVSNLKRWDQELKLKEQGIEVPDGRERNLRFDQAVRDRLVVRVLSSAASGTDGFKESIVTALYSYEMARAAAKECQAMDQFKDDPRIQSLKLSDHWVHDFLVRENFSRVKVNTDKGDTLLPPLEEMLDWFGKWRAFLHQHGIEDPRAVCNADEACDNIQATFDSMYHHRSEHRAADEVHNPKERIGQMFGVWGTGDMLPAASVIKCYTAKTDQSAIKVLSNMQTVLNEKDGVGVWEEKVFTVKLTNPKKKEVVEYTRKYLQNSQTNAIVQAQRKAWLDRVGFILWAVTVLAPEMEKRGLKKICLLVDSASTHKSPQVEEILMVYGIYLFCLIPNSTNVLQIVDLCIQAVFKAMTRHDRIDLVKVAFDEYRLALATASLLGSKTPPAFVMPAFQVHHSVLRATKFVLRHNSSAERMDGVRRMWLGLGFFVDPSTGGYKPLVIAASKTLRQQITAEALHTVDLRDLKLHPRANSGPDLVTLPFVDESCQTRYELRGTPLDEGDDDVDDDDQDAPEFIVLDKFAGIHSQYDDRGNHVELREQIIVPGNAPDDVRRAVGLSPATAPMTVDLTEDETQQAAGDKRKADTADDLVIMDTATVKKLKKVDLERALTARVGKDGWKAGNVPALKVQLLEVEKDRLLALARHRANAQQLDHARVAAKNLGTHLVIAPSGFCFIDSVLQGLGEAVEFDKIKCELELRTLVGFMRDEAFQKLKIPILEQTFGEYSKQFLAKCKVKKMLDTGIEEVQLHTIQEYCDSLLERYGNYNSVVMWPEAGILGHVAAEVYNAKINIYDHNSILKECYSPMSRDKKREPLVVNLLYKFGVGQTAHFDLFMHLYCICKRPNAMSVRFGDVMIQCKNGSDCVGHAESGCGEWYHQACLNFNNTRWADAREDAEWLCPFCPGV